MQTECLQWFPMRVTYSRELKMKACFNSLNIECFLPMRYEIENDGLDGMEKLVPAIHNLIFVHSTQKTLTDLKMEKKEFAPLRHIMKSMENGEKKILTVPDCEMENFMRVASKQDGSVFFIDNSDYINKVGKKVMITAGQFKDVVGVIKRIKKNKCVVVRIEGVAAVAITYVPSRFVKEI